MRYDITVNYNSSPTLRSLVYGVLPVTHVDFLLFRRIFCLYALLRFGEYCNEQRVEHKCYVAPRSVASRKYKRGLKQQALGRKKNKDRIVKANMIKKVTFKLNSHYILTVVYRDRYI